MAVSSRIGTTYSSVVQSLSETPWRFCIHPQIKRRLDKFQFHEPKAVIVICANKVGSGIKRDGIERAKSYLASGE
jgi:hypothetical protein